jgi:hypothetical protein
LGAIGRIAFLWGVLGVVVVVAQPLVRLTPWVVEAIAGGLSLAQWAVLAAWVVLNAHAEGYRGFHLRFSPRVIARARYLAAHPRPSWVLVAPLFCMSLLHASRRGLWIARGLVVGIVVLVLVIRQLPQPWRGIVDAGVVVGLALGLASLLYHFARHLLGHAPPMSPDLPEG